MIIGFTGTQKGMTAKQLNALQIYIEFFKPEVVHHGDCIGADEQFHNVCTECGIPITIHPPLYDSKRAFCRTNTILPQKDYIARNHDIVDASDVLIATPFEVKEQLRSGTWATIRYAKKKSIPVVIITPEGEYNYYWSEFSKIENFMILTRQNG